MRLRALFFSVVWGAAAILAGCRDANSWIKKLRFQPITPPSNLLAPGAVVMRKHGFGEVRLLCTAEESLGADFKASQSRTIGGRFSRGKQVGWRLSGDALKQVKIAANSDTVESVHVKVSQARIENLTDTDVFLALSHRSAACAAAMRRRREQGWELSLITRCLRADVSYGIQFKDEGAVDVQAKLANLQAVNAALGGSFQSTSDRSAAASNLIWGFSDDVYLAKIDMGDRDVLALEGQMPIRSKRQSIMLPDESLTTADPNLPPDDNANEPSWGVSTDDEAADPVPGFDDAVKDAATLTKPPSHGYSAPETEEQEQWPQEDAGENTAEPISPRSRHRQQ